MFNIGDRVIISSAEPAFVAQWQMKCACQPGIITAAVLDMPVTEQWFNVRFPNGYENNYGAGHLTLAGPAPLSSAEYDDILAGQEIYNEMEGSNG